MTWDNRLTFEVLSDVRNANPYFETNASGWTGKGGSLVRSTAQFHEGVASGLLTPTGVAATTEAESNSAPVVPLAPYRLTAWVWCAVARNIALNINWFSASAYLSTSSATPVAVAATTWTQLTFTTATAPGTAATATGLVSMTGTPPVGHTLNFDEAILTNVDDSGGQWNNLTTRIRDLIQPVTTSVGRQNDLNQSEPGRLDLLLDNSDNALTYGNTASPYALWWGPGRKCRLRELVNGVTTTRFTGYLQVPTESLITAGIEQRVAITAVDRLGRLASGAPFVSTLTEYIRTSYPATLARYWALNGNAVQYGRTTYIDAVVGKTIAAERGTLGDAPAAVFVPSDGPVAPADDLNCPRFTPGPRDGYRLLCQDPSTPLPAGQVLTVMAWFLPSPASFVGDDFINAGMYDSPGGPNLRVFCGPNGFIAQVVSGGLSGTINTGASLPVDVPTPIAIRYGFSPSVFEVWIGAQGFIGTLTGIPPTTSTLIELIVGNMRYAGRIGHIQVHVGPAASFGQPEFLAQQQMGLNGLERQTTGDRIRTIAQYAGIPAAELAQIDKGQSVMQIARLAGKDPLSAMRDAERTEQGLLYADGSGNLVFEDRSSLYNI